MSEEFDYLVARQIEAEQASEQAGAAAEDAVASTTGQLPIWDGTQFSSGELDGDATGVTISYDAINNKIIITLPQTLTTAGEVEFAKLAINGGTDLTKVVVYSPNLTPASVAANTSAEEDFNVVGLATSDKIILNGPAPTAGTGIVNVRVKAADTLSITFGNFTAGALTPAAGDYLVIAIRS